MSLGTHATCMYTRMLSYRVRLCRRWRRIGLIGSEIRVLLYGHVYFVHSSSPASQSHHGKVSQISNLGPIFIRWRPRGTLRILSNHKRGDRAWVPRPRSGPADGPRPWPHLLWFLGILRQPLGLQRINMGTKLLI